MKLSASVAVSVRISQFRFPYSGRKTATQMITPHSAPVTMPASDHDRTARRDVHGAHHAP